MYRTKHLILTFFLLANLSFGGEVKKTDKYQITKPPAYLNLSPFYAKHVSASGYPVLGSNKVNNYALKEAD